MEKDASFQLLIDMCNKVGWDIGIKNLEKIVLQNENAQAYLYGGEPSQIKQAQNLSKTIIQQNITINLIVANVFGLCVRCLCALARVSASNDAQRFRAWRSG